MDKEMLRVLIHEVFAACEDAASPHKVIVAVLRIAEATVTSDAVLTRLLGTVGASLAAPTQATPTP